METHVIHTFKEDFYGEILSVVMVGYIRPERTYDSLEALIAAINSDIEEAKLKLELPEHLKLKEDNFFTSTASSSSVLPSTTASTSQTIMNGHWQLAGTAALCAYTHKDQSNTEVSMYIQVCVNAQPHFNISQLSL